MNYLESISLSAFVLGGVSLAFGIFLTIYFSAVDLSAANPTFYAGVVLWIAFWVIAIGVKSYSKTVK